MSQARGAVSSTVGWGPLPAFTDFPLSLDLLLSSVVGYYSQVTHPLTHALPHTITLSHSYNVKYHTLTISLSPVLTMSNSQTIIKLSWTLKLSQMSLIQTIHIHSLTLSVLHTLKLSLSYSQPEIQTPINYIIKCNRQYKVVRLPSALGWLLTQRHLPPKLLHTLTNCLCHLITKS